MARSLHHAILVCDQAETGKVVPTELRRRPCLAHAASSTPATPAHLAALTAHNEAAFEAPWHIRRAWEIYEKLMGAIGIEIVITRLSGKGRSARNSRRRTRRR